VPSKKTKLNDWLSGRPRVTHDDFLALQAEIPISAPYLRKLLRQAPGIALEPAVEGVRQDTFENLERTLAALGPHDRALVREARRHARLSLRSPRTDRTAKEEMIAWMTVWLETPDAFPTWLALRRRAIATRRPTP
jgi:hypothetical protein